MTEERWWERARCSGSDPSVFDAGRRGRPPSSEPADPWWRARALCSSCPVRAECLADAMAGEDALRRYGFRGGLAPDERSGLAAGRARRA